VTDRILAERTCVEHEGALVGQDAAQLLGRNLGRGLPGFTEHGSKIDGIPWVAAAARTSIGTRLPSPSKRERGIVVI